MNVRLQFALRLPVAGLFYCLLVMGPTRLLTGSWHWPRGWLAIALLLGLQVVTGTWMLRHDPGLLAARMAPGDVSPQDKRATALIAISILAWFLFNPIDVHALRLLPALPPALSVTLGAALVIAAMLFLLWTVCVNHFAVSVVAVQEGQRVVDTGPYARVRHPMYAGLVPALAGLALVMGSTSAALLSIPVVALGLLPRILLEERTLAAELPGYADYLQRVRWRLLPGVF